MKKKKNKKKKTFLNFLKNYAAVITIGMSIVAFIANALVKYHSNSADTNFYYQYLTLNIEDKNFVKKYKDKNYGGFYNDLLQAPTYNNSINQLLYKYPDKAVGYYITYLIIEQKGNVPAEYIKLNFKQYSQDKKIAEHELKDLVINKKGKNISNKIKYPFPKGEKIKIPISICKYYNEFKLEQNDCYYINLVPESIEYKNKYLFSKRKLPIRSYAEKNVIIDGEVITGKGSTE